MSNQSALVSLPAGLSLPASASVKQTRDVAKNLLRLAGESALASGTVKPETSYAFGLGLALLGVCDNQSAPLVRVKALMGEKPNKAQSARLQYWSNCTSAGKAAWNKDAESIDLLALVSQADIDCMSAAALASAAENEKARKAAALLEEANKKRIADTEAAAAASIQAAAAAAEAAAASIHAAAYAGVAAHGQSMDNVFAFRHAAALAEAEAAAAIVAEAAKAEAERKAAWLKAAAASYVADLATDKAKAAAAFAALADTLGIVLTSEQAAALSAFNGQQAAAATEAAAACKAKAEAATEAAAIVKASRKASRKAA